ncbi:MAG TPA: hypothetical protein VJM11_12025, partial [Nevskiaceae bacterium]|nr:hypothetical protein [Nevskiaceae bacterium]
RWIAVGALAFVAIPYAVTTARSSLYPQLENGPYEMLQGAAGTPAPAGNAAMDAVLTAQQAQEYDETLAQEAAPMAEPAPPPAPLEAEVRRKVERFASKADDARNVSQSSIQWLDPNVLTQTGPGLPGWQWRQANLNWSGPVTVDQTFRLWLIPPWLTRTLGWASIALILLVALRWIDLKRPRAQGFGSATAMLAVMLLGLAGALAPEPAHAQDDPGFAPPPPSAPPPPTDAILQQLRQRLTAPPDCMPACAAFARMSVAVDGDRLLLRLVADAAVDTALPLPLPPVAAGSEGRTWQPQSVLLDERAAALLRDENGRLWVRVGAGRRTVAISGSLAGFSQVQIPFPAAPHRVEVSASGWLVAGVDANGQPGAALDLSREKGATVDGGAEAATDAEEARQALPPLFVLTRTVRMGLVWSVESTLERLGNSAGAHVATVDLLPGETVTGEAVRVVDGRVQASFAPSQLSIGWTGRLATTPKLALTASPSTEVFEIWRFDISPLWHAQFSGLAPVAHQEADFRLSTFRPWPGEKVAVAVAKPEGVKGQVLTLDRASLHVQPGKRATDHVLTMTLRASQGGQHAIPLPHGLTLQRLTVDGAQQPARREGGRVVVPLHPGTQTVSLAMRGEEGLGTRLVTPPLVVGLPGVNADVVVGMPGDRWILFAGGPRLGPAVLFWGALVVLLAIAIGLAKTGITPLKGAAWSLLVIGLSQIPLWAAAIVAGWLFALALRGRMPQTWSARRANAVQVVLALWTLAALSALFGAVAQGLLGTPDMQIVGNGSSAHELRWYQDRYDGHLPSTWVLSVSIWVY